jgi:hypothetical protein
MWTTVLILALALNLEPNRLAIIGLLLIRPHPIRQLVAFLITSFLVAGSAGLLILSLIHRGSFLSGDSSSAKVQIGVGAVALIAAAVLGSNISFGKRRAPEGAGTDGDQAAGPDGEPLPGTPQHAGIARVERITSNLPGWAAKLVQGSSPVLAIVLGIGNALPSVDYMALLLLIASSGMSDKLQVTALFTFLTIANAVLLVPIFSYVVAKDRTIRFLEGLRTWVLARRRQDYAILLGIAGFVLVAVGFSRL